MCVCVCVFVCVCACVYGYVFTSNFPKNKAVYTTTSVAWVGALMQVLFGVDSHCMMDQLTEQQIYGPTDSALKVSIPQLKNARPTNHG